MNTSLITRQSSHVWELEDDEGRLEDVLLDEAEQFHEYPEHQGSFFHHLKIL